MDAFCILVERTTRWRAGLLLGILARGITEPYTQYVKHPHLFLPIYMDTLYGTIHKDRTSCSSTHLRTIQMDIVLLASLWALSWLACLTFCSSKSQVHTAGPSSRQLWGLNEIDIDPSLECA